MTFGFSEDDIRFLLETAAPALLSKADTIKGDPAIVEGMMEHESRRLFERIMLMSRATMTTAVSPRFLFEVLLRTARGDLASRSYTVERTTGQKIPVFDTPEVVRFLDGESVLKYLADMLTSFNRVESFTVPVRVRKGVWRRVRFNDMDVDSLISFCQAVDEDRRFAYYKRIADVCLFILGMFPEYVAGEYHSSPADDTRPRMFGRLARTAGDYEEEGKRFYRLAGQHPDAIRIGMTDVLCQLNDNFNLAKKPLNYISEHFIQLSKATLFSPPA